MSDASYPASTPTAGKVLPVQYKRDSLGKFDAYKPHEKRRSTYAKRYGLGGQAESLYLAEVGWLNFSHKGHNTRIAVEFTYLTG